MGGFRNERVVRLALPVELIRRLDQALLEGRGGFETRTEFVREAVENMLLELSYDPAPPEPMRDTTRDPELDPPGVNTASISGRLLDSPQPWSETTDESGDARALRQDGALQPLSNDEAARTSDPLAATALTALPRGGIAFDSGVAAVKKDAPLFGLHNRDYPSIWAAHQLADLSREAPIGLQDYFDEVVRRAWQYAEELHSLELRTKRKLRTMFPTNLRKPQSAEEGFRTFAIGTVAGRTRRNSVAVSGPLFAWQICQLRRDEQKLLVALTGPGYDLLEALDGISLDTPHPREMATRFFDHLRRYSPVDWWGFETLLNAVSQEPDRAGLVAHFETARSNWSATIASTNSQGYVGRAREWGLVEPKQIRGRYVLTNFGKELLSEHG